MTYLSSFDFERRLRRRVRGAKRLAIIGIGDELNPHDRLGMFAAREIDGLRLPGVKVFFAGTVPESVTGPVRKYRPNHVVLLDAADMAARPGSLAIVEPKEIQARLFSTHALPLSVVMEYLAKETKAGVTLIGIQPDTASHGRHPSALEEAGLTRLLVSVHRVLSQESRTAHHGEARGSHAM
ncbi:MAG TPA: hydrogenase 3 maturation endopeptidase HyCI [Thermoplasmata archaeon]|jgi:hydrogenase 3 maturation protease